MTAAARRAYGQARSRARRASILSDEAIAGLAAAQTVTSVKGWRDLDPADDGSAVVTLACARLIEDYALVIEAYAEARGALTALLRLHEIENVKLLWRAAFAGLSRAEWGRAWIPLGRLQTVSPDRFDRPSTAQVVTALAGTPYAAIADRVLRAHGGDLAAAEVAFDRFGSEAVQSAKVRLPAAERSAHALLELVIARRDAAILQRATTTLGIGRDAAMSMTVSGRAGTAVPLEAVAALCRRVFAHEPFSLALPIALVLLREAERRRLVTLAELRARRAPTRDVRRQLLSDSRAPGERRGPEEEAVLVTG